VNGPIYTYAGPLPLRLSRAARYELGLDLVAPARVTPPRLARLVAFLAGAPPPSWLGLLHDRDSLRVRCDRPLPLQLDGEDVGDVSEVTLECERGAVSVLV
jgi:hypothetical protein